MLQPNRPQFCYPCFGVFRVPWIVARNLFRVLQQARHHIKTGYGISEPVYGDKDEQKPITGIVQGNGLGPSLWCLISTVIIKAYKRKGYQTTITTPISKKDCLSSRICLRWWRGPSYYCQQSLKIRRWNDSKDASSYDQIVWLYSCHRWTHRSC